MSDRAADSLRGLVDDDDMHDRIADAYRPGEPPGDVACIVADTVDAWLGQLDSFVVPWEPAAVDIMQHCIASVRERDDARLAAMSSMRR